ncbi:MAG: hypothetical protein AAF654_05005 [Myxococcota bacterium]
MGGFSLRGQKSGKGSAGESRALLRADGFSADAVGADPQARLKALEEIVDTFEGSSDPRCQALRQRIIDVLAGLAKSIRSAQAGNEKQARIIAKKTEKALLELEPDALEANYFLAHQYLSRHYHAHPPGTEHALADDVRVGIERYATASRSLAHALRGGDQTQITRAHDAFLTVNGELAKALDAQPAFPIGPAS